jgi:hypothetical protein
VKKIVLLTALCLAFVHLNAQAQIRFVKAGSHGNGESWATAYGDLQQALLHAKPGQQIWVAAGTYYPTSTNNRTIAFVIPNEVQVYGGFAGNETDFAQRNWEKNLTILSGEIGTNDPSDNSYTVVYTERVSSSTIIDGFAITGGTANGVNSLGDIQRCGAGWYNNGSNGASNPKIINCLFMNNYGRDGAAMYNFAENGRCAPKLINCQFVANKADLDGGAIFNDGRQGFTMLEVDHCIFSGNSANFGAGINNHADNNGESRLILKNSVFEGNISYVRNTINDNELTGGSYDLIKKACRFTDNVAVVGDNNDNSQEDSQSQPRNTYKQISKISYLRF